MVEVDGDEGGQKDQHHAGWTATADLLRGQVVLIMLKLMFVLMLNTQREAPTLKK